MSYDRQETNGHKIQSRQLNWQFLPALDGLREIRGSMGKLHRRKVRKYFSLTVNSPVTESKPTCMVCSKSEGLEISGRSLSLSFFLPSTERMAVVRRFWSLAK